MAIDLDNMELRLGVWRSTADWGDWRVLLTCGGGGMMLSGH